MNKDAYYFPHFSNARHDRKLRRVRKELGIEGYAIYFMILEVLREQEDFAYPLKDVDLLADDFGTSEAKVEAIVTAYNLFVVDDDKFFYSPKFIEYLTPYLEKSNRARKAALTRWHGTSNANAMLEQSAGNASKREESKVNEKRKKIPSLQEVKDYFSENGYDPNVGERAYNLYQESIKGTKRTMWRDTRDNPIKNWKMKMQSVWFKPENELRNTNQTMSYHQEL